MAHVSHIRKLIVRHQGRIGPAPREKLANRLSERVRRADRRAADVDTECDHIAVTPVLARVSSRAASGSIRRTAASTVLMNLRDQQRHCAIRWARSASNAFISES